MKNYGAAARQVGNRLSPAGGLMFYTNPRAAGGVGPYGSNEGCANLREGEGAESARCVSE